MRNSHCSEKDSLKIINLLFIFNSTGPLLLFIALYLYTRAVFSFDQFIAVTSIISISNVAAFFIIKKQSKKISTLLKSLDRLRNKTLTGANKEIEHAKKTIETVLSKVAGALGPTTINSLSSMLLDASIETASAESGAVFLINENSEFEIKSISGFRNTPPIQVYRIAVPYLQWVLREKKTIVTPKIINERKRPSLPRPLLCSPIFSKGQLFGGLLLCGCRSGTNFTDTSISAVTTICTQFAPAFENARINENLERSYFEAIFSLALAIESRDPFSRGHSERVSRYAVTIGSAMGLSDKAIKTLHDASRLHDIGKIGITDSIFSKPASLTEEERKSMQCHTTIGEKVIMPLKTYHHLLDPIRHHHEYLDGSGYPDGLRESAIPLITRIITVSDIFDALTSDRPYRKSLGIDGARNELASLAAGGRIDGHIVDLLFTLIDDGKLSDNTMNLKIPTLYRDFN